MRRPCVRGMSLVELLVGVALALLIAAAAALLLGNNLRENRSLLIEARLTQDLRSASDLIVRDLRRAGHWGAAASAGVWSAPASGAMPNPYTTVTPFDAATDSIAFRYSQDATENNAVGSNEQFGFRLRNETIEAQLGASNWQALTDANTMAVTQFRIAPSVQEVALDATCAARVQLRSLSVEIAGRSLADASVVRTIRSVVRLRNDVVSADCPA
jgi:prepilin peptidase dependent protein B